ncbi:hypothetical protein DICVIV_09143 [Dictyocaulus viviparus]|uniref:Uncharacterized protein n=1 Tax=Dictyocaulus viviparus TaxID=29172 RepID=A0A0D8XM11_DICVI|nr:hypothetical protein DICVIV_09143 [Dictyocaulus viviparus]
MSRTCATLFRKADGFMRHVMRCDSSRAGDVDSEPDKRTILISPTNVDITTKTSRIIPVRKPLANGLTPTPSMHSSTVLKQDYNLKETIVKMQTVPSTRMLEIGSENEVKNSPLLKRAQNRVTTQKSIPRKVQKMDTSETNDVSANTTSTSTTTSNIGLKDISSEIRPSRMRKTPKWLEDNAFVV